MNNRLLVLLVLPLTWLGASIEPVLAQPTEPQHQDILTFHFNPPDEGVPSNTTGGASRNLDLCRRQTSVTAAAGMTLLTPSSFIGLTVSERPLFSLYVERVLARQIFVTLQDDQGKQHYQGFQTLPANHGLIHIALPTEAPDLQLNRTYRLSVVPICAASLRPDDPVLTGYIKRVSPPEWADVAPDESSFDQAKLYAESGIWQDTLMLLSQDLSHDPENESLRIAWEALLTAGGFPEMTAASVTP